MLTREPKLGADSCNGEDLAGSAAALRRLPWLGDRLSRRWVQPALWGLPIAAVVLMAAAKRWTFDDGFIYFRTVDQILAGNGPVFNAGERVESFTSPLWLALLTTGDIVSPLRLEYTAAALAIGCTAVGMSLATLGSAQLVRSDPASRDRVLVPVGSVIFASLWPVWVWATSGLEVGVTYAWLGACLFVLARWATGPRRPRLPIPDLVVLGMGWLVRPELGVSSVVFVGMVVMFSGLSRRQRIRTIVVAAALPITYQVFRMGYYGLLVSSPAIAKEGAAANPIAGWRYLKDFLGPYVLALPLLAVALGVAAPFVRRLFRARQARSAAVVIGVSASGLLHAAAVVVIGGDYVHARLLLPALFAVLAPFFVVAVVNRNLAVVLAVGGWAILAMFVLRPAEGSRGFVMGLGYLEKSIVYEDYGFPQRGPDQPWVDGPGLYVAHWFGGGGDLTRIELVDADEIVVATYPLGAVGYVLGPDVRVVDLWGLADPMTGHRRLEYRGVPGHEKSASGPWLVARLARDPSVVLPNELDANGEHDPRPVGLEYIEQVAWAEAALQCPRLERLAVSYRAPLTVGRFLGNLWHSGENTRMRIAYDPRTAYEEECAVADLPESVADFYQRTYVASRLPEEADPGTLVVIDECAVVYLATGQRDDPWVPVDGSTFSATVTFDRTDLTPRLAAVWVLRPYGEATALVWAESDGRGRFRLRQDIDWFPPSLQEWTSIPAGGVVRVRLTPDLLNRSWMLTAGPTSVASAPMTSQNANLDAIVPEAAGPSSTAGTVQVNFAAPQASSSCSRILSIEP